MADEKRTSNRTVPSAARPPSGRQAPRQVEEVAPPPPPRPAAVRRAGAGAPIVKKKSALPIKEILIAAGFLLFIFGISMVIWYSRTSALAGEKAKQKIQDDILDRNIEAVKIELKKAENAGTLFTVGKETIDPKDPSKLLGPFKSNTKIYNVIYNRDYKAKQGVEKKDQIALVDDLQHRTLKELNKAITQDLKDTTIKYGLAEDKEKLIPVILAKRIVHPPAGDPVNTGGTILVVVLAEEDNFFKSAMQKVTDGPKTPAPTETKPAESKVAPTEPKAPPADNKAPTETKAPADKAPAETKAPAENKAPATEEKKPDAPAAEPKK